MDQGGVIAAARNSRPRNGRIVAGLGVIGCGFLVFFGLLLYGLSGVNQTRIRVLAPGTSTVEFDRPGSYILFHEYKSFLGERVFDGMPSRNGFDIRIAAEAGGAAIETQRADTTKTYTARRRKGIPLVQFEVRDPGRYVVTSAYREGLEPADTVLSIMGWRRGGVQLLLARSWAVLLIPLAAGAIMIASGLRGSPAGK